MMIVLLIWHFVYIFVDNVDYAFDFGDFFFWGG
jgi:hypothetical protein